MGNSALSYAAAALRAGGAMNSGPTGSLIVASRMRSISVLAIPSARDAGKRPLERGGDLYRKRELGKLTWRVTPQGSLAVAQIRPSDASMIERQIESPIPMPVGFVE
jgi:hypothetical protein